VIESIFAEDTLAAICERQHPCSKDRGGQGANVIDPLGPDDLAHRAVHGDVAHALLLLALRVAPGGIDVL
jgi:hypothetical protein